MTKKFIVGWVLFLNTIVAFAQQPTSSIKGTVVDEALQIPIASVNIILLNTNPVIRATTDQKGNFVVKNVPVGRYELQATFIGYQSVLVKELIVSSPKVTLLNITMKEISVVLEGVVIKPSIAKEKPLNKMASVSARMLSVEEAKRYAGGFDDPARVASSFAGVASGVANNGIVVRGNAPKSLQWKMEGIEIPNPNHFADLAAFGGGGLTALSTQMLGNSDFFTGAFPAEYNNALSGVFDIAMRPGNSEDHEHTFQIGGVGIDVASEGPIKKGNNSSYAFNYRYSTLALVANFLPDEDIGGFGYQDLSYKLSFPSKKAGVFSMWGLGLMDEAKIKPKTDPAEWHYEDDREDYNAQQFMGATGINHKIFISNSSQLKTTLATTVSGIDWKIKSLNNQSDLIPKSVVNNTNWNFVFQSALTTKISAKHTNKTGFSATGLQYNTLLKDAGTTGANLVAINNESGFSTLLSAYTASTFNLSNKLSVNVGVNSQLFTLNNNATLEPRLGLTWQWKENQQFGFGYGLHSRLERINYFFTQSATTNERLNKDMDFTKSHHFIFSYSNKLSNNLILKVEPYFQYLFDVPVIANSSFSFINLQDDWFINNQFENTGKGRNYGIDLTLEKYLADGYYYMFTSSFFNSEYTGGDQIWRNTRYNRNYLFNLLGGKEWSLGNNRQNILGLNVRFTYQGGDRYTPYNTVESILAKDVVFDETRAFSKQIDPSFIAHFTASYKVNKKKLSHEFALKVLNATSYGDLRGFKYNFMDKTVDEYREKIMIPNLSYKIEF